MGMRFSKVELQRMYKRGMRIAGIPLEDVDGQCKMIARKIAGERWNVMANTLRVVELAETNEILVRERVKGERYGKLPNSTDS